VPVRAKTAVPRVVRLLAINAAIGGVVGIAAAAALLVSDAGGLATLMQQSGTYVSASALLFGGFALTFASLAMGSAVMMLPRK